MRQVILNGKTTLSVPESWNEVPRIAILPLLEALFVTQNLSLAIGIAIGLPRKKWTAFMRRYFGEKVSEESQNANAETLHVLYALMPFLTETPLNILPFKTLSNGWAMPEEAFRGMAFGELTDAYINAMIYIQQLIPGEERLNQLVGIIARPPRKQRDTYAADSDTREPYNDTANVRQATLAAKLPYPERLAVLLWFIGSLKGFLDAYDVSEETSGPEDYPGQGFLKNQHYLAEKGIFGNMAATKATSVHDIFLFLSEHKADLKAQAEAQRQANISND